MISRSKFDFGVEFYFRPQNFTLRRNLIWRSNFDLEVKFLFWRLILKHSLFLNLISDSVFDYIDLRFGKLVSKICLFSSMFSWMLYISACILAPALAIKTIIVDPNFGSGNSTCANSVSNAGSEATLYIIIFILSLICIFYTMAGGMKAVIWADTINGVLLARIFDFLKFKVFKIWPKFRANTKKSYYFSIIFAQNDVFYYMTKKFLNFKAGRWSLWGP